MYLSHSLHGLSPSPTHSFNEFLASECPHRGVAEEFASGQMLHLHPKRRMAPLHVIHPRTLEHLPRSGETLNLCKELPSLFTGKGDERGTSIDQAKVICMS